MGADRVEISEKDTLELTLGALGSTDSVLEDILANLLGVSVR